jgi:two-component system response regulator HydG
MTTPPDPAMRVPTPSGAPTMPAGDPSSPMPSKVPGLRLVLVDDEDGLREALRRYFVNRGVEVVAFDNPLRALDAIERESFDVGLFDIKMPDMTGLDLLERAKAVRPELEVVMITGHGTVEDAFRAVKLGAFGFLRKPFDDLKEVALHVERAFERRQLELRNRYLEARVDSSERFEGFVGRSSGMKRLFEEIARVARTDATVLVRGETGTGKELVARAIHGASRRAAMPMLSVNCGAMSETLLESTLFGYERGAFTGAAATKKGYFEAADGGTLFLDEIADTSAQTQVSFLRVLSAGEILRVGATSARKVDVRVIAASHKDLAKLVDAGSFRQDLYFRLKVVVLEIPPLRERRDDIPLLVRHFLNRFSERENKRIGHVTPAAMNALVHAPWPGNVRELQSAVESAVVMCAGDEVDLSDLSAELQGYAEVSSAAPALVGLGASASPHGAGVDAVGGPGAGLVGSDDDGAGATLDVPSHMDADASSEPFGGEDLFKRPFTDAKDVAVLEFERRYVQHVLAQTGHNIAAAARLAGLDRANFRRVMNRVLQRYPEAFKGLRDG